MITAKWNLWLLHPTGLSRALATLLDRLRIYQTVLIVAKQNDPHFHHGVFQVHTVWIFFIIGRCSFQEWLAWPFHEASQFKGKSREKANYWREFHNKLRTSNEGSLCTDDGYPLEAAQAGKQCLCQWELSRNEPNSVNRWQILTAEKTWPQSVTYTTLSRHRYRYAWTALDPHEDFDRVSMRHICNGAHPFVSGSKSRCLGLWTNRDVVRNSL